MLQIEQGGIFELAIKKIQNDEQNKQQAMQFLQKQQEEEQQEKKVQEFQQKINQQAQEEAKEIIRNVQENSQLDGNQKVEIETKLVPFIASQALGEAIYKKSGVKPHEIGLDIIQPDSKEIEKQLMQDQIKNNIKLAEAKRKLTEKLKEEKKVQYKNAIEQFNQMNLHQLVTVSKNQKQELQNTQINHKEIVEDVVDQYNSLTFEQLAEQKKQIENAEKMKIQQQQAQAEKAKQSAEQNENENDIDNPISQYMTMKHPEIIENIKNFELDEMAKGNYDQRHY